MSRVDVGMEGRRARTRTAAMRHSSPPVPLVRLAHLRPPRHDSLAALGGQGEESSGQRPGPHEGKEEQEEEEEK